MTKDQRVCFVVMGFGKKTDYESGRTLDLDATYEAIIKPAVEDAGFRCVRADEILHSGLIDARMYEMLLRADLVVADISTGNVNAVYELGVRHALRPNSTIIMKESKGKLSFDLDHVATFKYDHMGDDIGTREAKRAKADLTNLIKSTTNAATPDSPVYTFLPGLKGPQLTAEEFNLILDDAEANQDDLTQFIQAGELALSQSNFDLAIAEFQNAEKIKPQDQFILQKLALATYKSKKPSPIDALIQGLMIIEMLNPSRSNDPETLGITGAIRKRLWQETGDPVQLDAAIKFYERGFKIREDYYNGENLALCYEYRAITQVESNEALFDRLSAEKTRHTLIDLLTTLIESSDFDDRTDRKWIFATLANCHFALGESEKGDLFERRFRLEKPAAWELETFESSKQSVINRLQGVAVAS
jgi:tetratricopeptide (TPR) repeat protein